MVPLNLLASNPAHFLVKTTTTDTYSFQFFSNHQKRKHAIKKSLSCRAAKDQEDSSSFKNLEGGKYDRRDILLGLGGIYGTTAAGQAALADPIVATKCGVATKLPDCANIKEFCPKEYADEITDYTPPNFSRVYNRPAAHLVGDDYIKKYEKALAHMRSLPKEHPHSFAAQAAIHCAYCDGSYEMVGFPDLKIQVHNNWLFFPFHRWYLHFYEKIVAKYSGDPNFRIPYWNWDDAKKGALLPAMFANRDSPLYDKLRNEKNMKLKVDLNHMKPKIEFNESFVGDQQLESSNDHVMYTQMVSGSKVPSLFFGSSYRAGDVYDKIKRPGTIENQPHTQLHVWTGDPEQKLREDMGKFYSAGRDPVFYAHHANVDRMWNIWKTLDGDKHKDITDSDWLDASFLFYDEDEKLVRVKVRDCCSTRALGYDYSDVNPSWKTYKPNLKTKSNGGSKMADVANAAEMPKRNPQVFPKASQVFPKVVDGLIKVTVPRPKKSRSKKEKAAEEEILEIEGIEYNGDEYVGFNVFLNGENEIESGPNNAEFAGTYSNVPFKESDKQKVSLTLGISELLDTLGADGDDNVVVAIVPRIGEGKFRINGARIYLSSE